MAAFGPREEGIAYVLCDGDTLSSIAATCLDFADPVSGGDLAVFNWGTDDPAAVNRVLFEAFGFRDLDERDATSSVFRGENDARLSILLPTPLDEPIDADATTEVELRDYRTFAAVEITALDKWFLPGDPDRGGERCQLGFRLQGKQACADQVDLSVYGSNYGDASLTKEGTVDWGEPFSPPIPIYEETGRSVHPEATPELAVEDWHGQSSAARGALAAPRHINVVYSPYTVQLRLRKRAEDAEARLELEPFWIPWHQEPGELRASWKIHGCDRLKYGTVLFIDGTDRVVHRVPLAAPGGLPAAQSCTWDGIESEGEHRGERVSPERMPYRVQVQLHTDWNEEHAVALAAMHTEVRLAQQPQLAVAPPAVDEPDREQDLQDWMRYRLSLAGYHPGPVRGRSVAREAFRAARSELVRSFAPESEGRFVRVDPDDGQALMAALEAVPRGHRPLFGVEDAPWDQSPDLSDDAEVQRRLNDPEDTLAVWIDDRHVFTKHDADKLLDLNEPQHLGPLNGRTRHFNDDLMEINRRDIARPCIPLEVALAVLRRDDEHNHPLVLAALPEDVQLTMRRAVGPLAVAWTCQEIGEDLERVPTPDKLRIRSRACLQHLVVEGEEFTNCLESLGGIRPDDGPGHRAPFGGYYSWPDGGREDRLLDLEPWRSADGGDCIRTTVHDDLDGRGLAGYLGKSGIYFHPSRIAGDGYRLRATVGLAEGPNGPVLAARYPRPPRAVSARLRNWKKASIRGWVRWMDPESPHNRDGEQFVELAELYGAAFIRLVQEGAEALLPMMRFEPFTLLDRREWQDLLAQVFPACDPKYFSEEAPPDPTRYLWPLSHLPMLGMPPSRATPPQYHEWLQKQIDARTGQLYGRLGVRLLERIEERLGRMRGMLFIDFDFAPPRHLVTFRCSKCNDSASRMVRHRTDDDIDGNDCACGGSIETGDAYRAFDYKSMSLRGGIALINAPVDNRGHTWAHEMGHARGLQHSFGMPGPADRGLQDPPEPNRDHHDSKHNPSFGNELPTSVIHDHKRYVSFPNDQQWDCHCVMSYANVDMPLALWEASAFCGKCLLRLRGWEVTKLSLPPSPVRDP